MNHPELFVFDLDFTLWDCGGLWCDHTDPPFTKKSGHVYDSRGRHITLYPEVPAILGTLKQQGTQMALASRTSAPEWAQKLVHLFNIGHYFDFSEIYPRSKIEHFRELKAKSGLAYSSMIFFDDENRNIHEVSQLGVKSVLIPNGLQWKHIPAPFQPQAHAKPDSPPNI